MGPGIKSDLPGPSSTRDAEVAKLRNELELSAMRLSQMKTRLLATLDELDALRTTHHRELKTEMRVKERLSEKLDRCLDEIKRAEAERDEMREVVSILVDKVEKCNDYSAWPYSRMSLVRPLEPISGLSQINQNAEAESDAVRIALLVSAQKQLEDERIAHARTKEESDADILRLRAMVARRDAELEACTTHTAHRMLLASLVLNPLTSSTADTGHYGRRHTNDRLPGSQRENATGSRDEALLSQTLARQRMLEREVESLQRQVQRTRASQGEHPHPPTVAVPKYVALAHEPVDRAALASRTSSREAQKPPNPQILPVNLTSSPSYHALPPLAEPEHQVLRRELQTPRRPHAVPVTAERTSVEDLGLGDLKHQIDLLSVEIAAFSAERDALKKMLANAQEPSTPGPPDLVPAPALHNSDLESATRVLRREEECAREARALRQQLEDVTRERAQREQALQAEINTLRQALFDPSRAVAPAHEAARYTSGDLKVPSIRAVTPIPLAPRIPAPLLFQTIAANGGEHEHDDSNAGPSQGPGYEIWSAAPEPCDEDGFSEQSMEMATPLHPTILSLADDDLLVPSLPPTTQGNFADPANVPLPDSSSDKDADAPLIAFSPPSPPLLPPPAHLAYPQSSSAPVYAEPLRVPADLLARVESMSQARVDAIEREFEEKKRELDEKTRELEEKNAALDELSNTTTARVRAHDAEAMTACPNSDA